MSDSISQALHATYKAMVAQTAPEAGGFDIMTFFGATHLQIGKVYDHKDGKLVRIKSGQYLSNGQISNFWYWDFVDSAHRPTGEEGHGYGWSAQPVMLRTRFERWHEHLFYARRQFIEAEHGRAADIKRGRELAVLMTCAHIDHTPGHVLYEHERNGGRTPWDRVPDDYKSVFEEKALRRLALASIPIEEGELEPDLVELEPLSEEKKQRLTGGSWKKEP